MLYVTCSVFIWGANFGKLVIMKTIFVDHLRECPMAFLFIRKSGSYCHNTFRDYSVSGKNKFPKNNRSLNSSIIHLCRPFKNRSE